MAYKAIVLNTDTYGNTHLDPFVIVIDASNNTIYDNRNFALTFGTDIVNYTEAEIKGALETAILNYSVTFSLGMTAADIVWCSPNLTVSKSFSAASRSLNSAFQISANRDAVVTYSVDIAATLSLTTGQVGTVIVEYADDSGISTNVVEIGRFVNGNAGTLAIGLNLTQTQTANIGGLVPAGKYVRIRTVNTTGTPTFNFRSGQEVLF